MESNNKDKIPVTNIQRFSLHDGPGIRTTIFLKGCSLRCPWCCNPENISPKPQPYKKDGTEGIYGKYMTSDELYNEIIKDKDFYDSDISYSGIGAAKNLKSLPGGITFSGGEPLLQMKKLKPLLQRLKQEHIHMTVETSLYGDKDSLEIALEYIDLFYIDIKSLDIVFCKNIIGGSLERYMTNMQAVFDSEKSVVIRIPVIGGYTDSYENRHKIIDFLKINKNNNILSVELLKEHNLGNSKYMSIGYKPPQYKGVSDEFMELYKKEMEENGIKAEICRI